MAVPDGLDLNSNGWIIADMTGGSYPAALNGGIASFWNPQQNLQEVFYVGANQHVYEDYNNSNGWVIADMTGGNYPAALNGGIASFWNSQQNLQEVFYVGANQHVYEAFYSNGWIIADMTGGSYPAALNGGIASFWNPQQNLQEVFYVGANQHVYEAYYANGWTIEDMTGGSYPAALNGGIASFWNPQQNLQEVFYVGANQHVYEDYNNSNGWIVADMTGGNYLAMILYTISGQVTAGGSPVSGVAVSLSGTTAVGTNASQTTASDSNGNYSLTAPVGGTYTITPSLAGYTFSPASQTFNNVGANQTAQTTTAAHQPATCTTQVSVSSSPIAQGSSEIISVSISSPATGVSFAITGASTNPYSNSIFATRVGTSLNYQATLSTSGLLGEYEIVPVINNSGTPYSCGGSVEFFNVITGTEPTQPAAIKCSSVSGKWTDAASGQANLVWTLTDNAGTISGNVTSQDPCGNQLTWDNINGSYTSSSQTYKLTATGAASTSCAGGFTPYDQVVNGTIQNGSCGLGSGTFQAGPGIVSGPPGTVAVSGNNTLTVTERIPSGEKSNVTNTAADWLDQYGAVTKAQFNISLSSPSGYSFGGRTVTETAGSSSQGSDTCTYPGAPWGGKILTLATQDQWNVQNSGQNGGYGPDLVGLSADTVAYIQAFNRSLGSGCTISYPQIMMINKETASGTEAYGATNSGNNTIQFTVTPTSISVQRGNATITRPFHF